MTPDKMERVVATVLSAAKDDPLRFLDLLVRRALSMPDGAAAVPLFSQSCRDMAEWYAQQANALEAIARAQNYEKDRADWVDLVAKDMEGNDNG